MKATLKFDLTKPESREEFDIAIKASTVDSGIREFDRYLRDRLKYEELSEAVEKTLEEVRERLYEEVMEYLN